MEDKEDLKQYMLKEIDIIQNIIKRMAYNSFLIKGWNISLVVITLLLKGTKYQVYLAFIPLIVFWFLDAYFLWQERMYRKLYEWVINNRLKTDKYLFSMRTDDDRLKNDKIRSKCSIIKTMFSITLLWFYGSIAILVIIYAILIN